MKDTLPRLLLARAAEHGERTALRENRLGIWQACSWARYAVEVRRLALGLARLGFSRGDRLAVVGDNRPGIYDAILATQSLGGTPLGLYQDGLAEEVAFVLDHAEVRVVVAEDQEQVDKVLAVADRLPCLERLVYLDPRGLRCYDPPRLISFDAISTSRPRWQPAPPATSPYWLPRPLERADSHLAIPHHEPTNHGAQTVSVVLIDQPANLSRERALELLHQEAMKAFAAGSKAPTHFVDADLKHSGSR